MRCSNCNYSLWNQPAPADGSPRQCPECGTAYTVDRYAFAHAGVEFSCPKCSKVYYGTDAKGHLEPREFDCIGCGEHLTMERCTLRPAQGLSDAQAMRVEPLPWLTAPGGLPLGAWWRTVAACISKPSMIAPRSEAIADVGPPIRFLGLTLGIVYAISTAVALLFAVLTLGLMVGALPTGAATAPALTMILVTVINSLVSMAIMVGGLALAAIAIPRFVAGENLSFHRMFSVLSFASASTVFYLVPICGGLIGPIVWIVMCSQAVAGAVPQGRASTAVVVTVACLLGAILLQCGVGFAANFLLA